MNTSMRWDAPTASSQHHEQALLSGSLRGLPYASSTQPWSHPPVPVGDQRRHDFSDYLPTGLLEEVYPSYSANLFSRFGEPGSGTSSLTASTACGTSSTTTSSGYGGGNSTSLTHQRSGKGHSEVSDNQRKANWQSRGHKPRLNADIVLADEITSLMIHNLPMSLSQDNIRDELDGSGFANLYDFLYVPYNLKTSSICGYAFINLVNHEAAALLVSMWDQCTNLCGAASDRLIFFSAADVQGYEAHVERFTKGSKRCLRDPRFRPVLRRGPAAPANTETQALRPQAGQLPMRGPWNASAGNHPSRVQSGLESQSHLQAHQQPTNMDAEMEFKVGQVYYL